MRHTISTSVLPAYNPINPPMEANSLLPVSQLPLHYEVESTVLEGWKGQRVISRTNLRLMMAFRSCALRSLSRLVRPQGLCQFSLTRSFAGNEAGAKPEEPADTKPDEGKSANPNTSPELQATLEQVKTLGEEVLKYKDYCRRALAEQENIRKRLQLEMDNERVYSISKFAKEMLDVADNLTRTIESVPKDAKTNPENAVKTLGVLLDGVNLTNTSLKNTLKKFDIEEYQPLGEKFDPRLHEALFNLEDSARANGTVGLVLSSGYRIKDRVLRVAKVGVVKNTSAA